MLPAYLSLYLGSHEDDFRKRSPVRRALRALLIGAVVSLGFILLFGLAGVVVSAGGNAILRIMPWVGAVIGAVLVLMGIWMLAGRGLYTGVFERVAERVGDPKATSVRSFFLFGLAYGLASLSCTLPVFLSVVGSSITAGSFASGAGRFLSYGLGMASVLLTPSPSLWHSSSRAWSCGSARPYPTSSWPRPSSSWWRADTSSTTTGRVSLLRDSDAPLGPGDFT